jgi:hypothetical protein
MTMKSNSKRTKVTKEEIPPTEFDYQYVDRFWLYSSSSATFEIWYNPPRRRLDSLPTRYLGEAFYRSGAKGVKKWGAFVRFSVKKPFRFIGMHKNSEDIGLWLYENFKKIK